MPETVTNAQIVTGLPIILGILLLCYLVTKYTRFGGGSNYGGGKDGRKDDHFTFD